MTSLSMNPSNSAAFQAPQAHTVLSAANRSPPTMAIPPAGVARPTMNVAPLATALSTRHRTARRAENTPAASSSSMTSPSASDSEGNNPAAPARSMTLWGIPNDCSTRRLDASHGSSSRTKKARPVSVSSPSAVACSSSRQSMRACHADSVSCSALPWALRIIRERPLDAARKCPGGY